MNPSICEIVIVRHGETIANNTGYLQGQQDTALNDFGRLQAEAAAERLKNEHFDAAFSSDLGRAMETAMTIAKRHEGLTVTPVKELREWHLGELEGKRYVDLVRDYPDIMAAFKTATEELNVPGGESLTEFQGRLSGFLDRIAAEYAGKRLLFVSHGGAIQRILSRVTGPLAPGNIRPLCANASISVIRHLPDGWQLVTWSDTAHLANIQMHDTLAY